MGVTDLFKVGETTSTPTAFMCDRCGTVWGNEKDCAWCCGPVQCESCSKVIEKPYSEYGGLCWECQKAQLNSVAAQQESDRFVAATKVEWTEKTPVVFFLDSDVGQEGFWYDDEPPEGTSQTYAWTCNEVRPAIEASSVIESILDDFDDALHLEFLSGPAQLELQTLLDAWLEKYGEKIVSYVPNHTKCVLLPRRA